MEHFLSKVVQYNVTEKFILLKNKPQLPRLQAHAMPNEPYFTLMFAALEARELQPLSTVTFSITDNI